MLPPPTSANNATMAKKALRPLCWAFCLFVCARAFFPRSRFRTHLTFKATLNSEQQHKTASSTADLGSIGGALPHAHVADRTRPDFEILSKTISDKNLPLIYLDSAATSQKPRQVLRALNDYYTHSNANVHRGAHTLSRQATDAYEAARDKVANFIQASSRHEVVFTSGATEAINLVVSAYGRSRLQAGDEVVLTVAEHHSNLVPWHMLAKEKDVKLKFVKLNPETHELDLNSLQSVLTGRTKLVAFQHVSNVLGCVNRVETMVNMVRNSCPNDVKILLDACQSVPHMPVNVQELRVDFLAASGHKMCGPTGIGFLWAPEELLNSMPPYQGGGEMIDEVRLYDSTWQPAPARFEAGTPPVAQAVGLGAAVDYLQEIGMETIAAYEHELGAYLYQQLSAVPGITVLGPKHAENRAALCSFVHERVHPSDLSAFLDMEGVAIRAGHHCCQPLHTELGYSHSARASLAFYNTKAEIDAFVKHLKGSIDFIESLKNSADDVEDAFVPFV